MVPERSPNDVTCPHCRKDKLMVWPADFRISRCPHCECLFTRDEVSKARDKQQRKRGR